MADVTRYVSMQLPIPLAREVDILISDKTRGYRSRNEFCVEAIRRRIEYIKNNGNQTQLLECKTIDGDKSKNTKNNNHQGENKDGETDNST